MANGLSRKLATPATLLAALLLATQFGLAPSAFADDDDDSVRSRTSARTNYRGTSRSSAGTRSDRERTPSSSRYYDRSSRGTTDSRSSTDSVSKDSSSRYTDRASRSQYQSAEDRYSSSRPTTGSSGSSGSASISEAQFRILEDKLERLERKLDEVALKVQQERGRLNGVAQTVSPMVGDVSGLKNRVTMLENHSPNGQITNQVNTLNQQVSDIKRVINTIPGISI